MKYRNPIIPGFYPDPSVCRVGEDYYLVNSSFEFFPGVPLYHSRDLVQWEQIGHVLTRESQVPLRGANTSGGIYAPTIRFHNGRYYMITTNVNFQPGDQAGGGLGNFIVHTEDIRGEWSEPVRVSHMGIDPSLFWDDDGKCYLQGPTFGPDGRQFIGQYQLDPDTGETLSETRCIWTGTGGKCPEGPHLYKINGTYYLMIAEGGTEWGHMETIARADNVWGPFESCPHNPIVSNRDLSPSFTDMARPDYQELGCIGHADLVDDANGRWWMVFHGVRPSSNQLHHIGRETMLAPVEWVDGWPVVNGGKFITTVMEAPDTPEVRLGEDGFAVQNDFLFAEDFTRETALPARWAFLRNPREENYAFDNGLALTAGEDDLNGLGSPTFTGVRQRSMFGTVETVVEFAPESEKAQAGLTVFHTAQRHYDLVITCREGKRVAVLYRRAADLEAWGAPVELPDSGPVRLKITCDKKKYEFFANDRKVGEGCTQLLATEAMAGTFTGCFFGVFCQGEPGARAVVKSFEVQAR